MVTLVLYLMIQGIRDIHPPSIAFIALIEHNFMVMILNGHPVFLIFRLVNYRIILLTVVVTIYKIPNDLRNKLYRLFILIKCRIYFIKSNRCEFITHPCIAGYLASFFTVKS